MGCGNGDRVVTPYNSRIDPSNSPTLIVKETTPEPNLADKIHDLSKSRTPSASPVKTKARCFENKGSFRCFFCRGKGCYHENWLNNLEPAIKGLNSDFITPYVIASQRLSNRLIEEFKIIEQFKR